MAVPMAGGRDEHRRVLGPSSLGPGSFGLGGGSGAWGALGTRSGSCGCAARIHGLRSVRRGACARPSSSGQPQVSRALGGVVVRSLAVRLFVLPLAVPSLAMRSLVGQSLVGHSSASPLVGPPCGGTSLARLPFACTRLGGLLACSAVGRSPLAQPAVEPPSVGPRTVEHATVELMTVERVTVERLPVARRLAGRRWLAWRVSARLRAGTSRGRRPRVA